MNTAMRDSDKRLLSIMITILIIVVFSSVGIRGLVKSRNTMNKELEKEQEKQQVIQMKENMYPMAVIDVKNYRKDILAEAEEIYPLMKSDRIDELLTGLALEHELSCRQLNVPENYTAAAVTPYKYSEAAGKTQPDGSNVILYKASVSMQLAGSKENLTKLTDLLQNEYPSIRVTSYRFEEKNNNFVNSDGVLVINKDSVLSISMDVYMCDKDKLSEEIKDVEVTDSETKN